MWYYCRYAGREVWNRREFVFKSSAKSNVSLIHSAQDNIISKKFFSWYYWCVKAIPEFTLFLSVEIHCIFDLSIFVLYLLTNASWFILSSYLWPVVCGYTDILQVLQFGWKYLTMLNREHSDNTYWKILFKLRVSVIGWNCEIQSNRISQ